MFEVMKASPQNKEGHGKDITNIVYHVYGPGKELSADTMGVYVHTSKQISGQKQRLAKVSELLGAWIIIEFRLTQSRSGKPC